MLLSYLSRLLLFGAILIMVGCTTGKPAREVARLTLKQVISYEEEVNSKIKSEQKYYKDKVNSFQEGIKSDTKTRQNDIVSRSAQDFQNLVIFSKNEISEKQLRDSIDKVLGNIKQMRTENEQLLINYQSDFLTSLEKLEYNKKTLELLRKDLAKLQARPKDYAKLKELFEYGKDVKKEYDKLEKEK